MQVNEHAKYIYMAKTAIYGNDQYLSKPQGVLNLSGSLVTTFA